MGVKLVRSYPTEPDVARNGMLACGCRRRSFTAVSSFCDRLARVKSKSTGLLAFVPFGMMLQVKFSFAARVMSKVG